MTYTRFSSRSRGNCTSSLKSMQSKGMSREISTKRKGENALLAIATVSHNFWCSFLKDAMLRMWWLSRAMGTFFSKLSNIPSKSAQDTQNKQNGTVHVKLLTVPKMAINKWHTMLPFHGWYLVMEYFWFRSSSTIETPFTVEMKHPKAKGFITVFNPL